MGKTGGYGGLIEVKDEQFIKEPQSLLRGSFVLCCLHNKFSTLRSIATNTLRSTVIHIILALLWGNCAFAQSPGDRIELSSINFRYLEHLVKKGIDSVRISHGLEPLVNDSILYVAARDHASYLVRKKLLSHFENDIPEKRTPYDRVIFHGGKDFASVGENVISTFIHTPVKSKNQEVHIAETYGQAANDMVTGWVNSPRHFQNIINPTFKSTGVAVMYDPEGNNLKGVQKFGLLSWSYSPEENPEMFSYSDFKPKPVVSSFDSVERVLHKGKHYWHLKPARDPGKTCVECEDLLSENQRLKILTSGKNISLYTRDVEMIKRLLKKRRDGMAIEIVTYRPFDCGNPAYYTMSSRRNGQCIFNGKVLKPKYKRQLLEQWRKEEKKFKRKKRKAAWKIVKDKRDLRGWFSKPGEIRLKLKEKWQPTEWKAKLGRDPRDETSYYEFNIVILQKKKVCRVLHFTDVCGEHYEDTVKLSWQHDLNEKPFELKPAIKELKFTVPFEQGKFDYKLADIKPLIDSLSADEFIILDAVVKAYASVEGSEAINKKLQEQRAQSILAAMQQGQHEKIVSSIETMEDWNLFYEQLHYMKSHYVLSDKPREEIKALLENKDFAETLESAFEAQRRAEIALKVQTIINQSNRGKLAVEMFNRMSDSLAKAKHADPAIIDSMERIQSFVYKHIFEGSIDTLWAYKMNIPLQPGFQRLLLNQLWFENNITAIPDSNEWRNKTYNRLNTLISFKQPSWQARWNMLVFLHDTWSNGPINSGIQMDWILQQLSSLENAVPFQLRKSVQELNLDFHFKAVLYYHSQRGGTARIKKLGALSYIFNHYNGQQLTPREALTLARFFVHYEVDSWAQQMLIPFALCENPDKEALAYLLKLTYQHIEEYPLSYYFEMVKYSSKIMSPEEWCPLFIGPCNISFQLFDHEELRDLYCEQCATYRNYAKDPAKWEKGK